MHSVKKCRCVSPTWFWSLSRRGGPAACPPRAGVHTATEPCSNTGSPGHSAYMQLEPNQKYPKWITTEVMFMSLVSQSQMLVYPVCVVLCHSCDQWQNTNFFPFFLFFTYFHLITEVTWQCGFKLCICGSSTPCSVLVPTCSFVGVDAGELDGTVVTSLGVFLVLF